MKILGIETSCDETAAAVVEMDEQSQECRMLSNTIVSQIDIHKAYGGVVPEIAARSHIEAIIPVIDEALRQSMAGDSGLKTLDAIDAIAVTQGAGLGGSLLIGVMTARSLAIAAKKPLYAINHVEAHVYANFITSASEYARKLESKPGTTRNSKLVTRNYILNGEKYTLPSKPLEFPILALIVSGGHTQLVFFNDHFNYQVLGKTQDDAIGEAFDKVAKMIGLPYPGGPSIAKLALHGNPHKYQFPKAKLEPRREILDYRHEMLTENHKVSNLKSRISYDFSFSGLKTAVLRVAQQLVGHNHTLPSSALPGLLSEAQKADIAASFQRVAIEMVVDKTVDAYNEYSPTSVVIAGGVASSDELRRQLSEKLPVSIEYTDKKLCTDNAAMVATLGCFKRHLRSAEAEPHSLEIQPNLKMQSL